MNKIKKYRPIILIVVVFAALLVVIVFQLKKWSRELDAVDAAERRRIKRFTEIQDAGMEYINKYQNMSIEEAIEEANKEKNAPEESNLTRKLEISEESKDFAIEQAKAHPGVKDASISERGDTLSLALIVDYGTSKEKAKELGESFVRLVKTFCENNPPGEEIGKTTYDYLIGVYYPNKKEIVFGAKSSIARKIMW